MDLYLWAQLNMVGNVSYHDYCEMTREEAQACLKALEDVINAERERREKAAAEEARKREARERFERAVSHYQGGGQIGSFKG